MEGSGMDDWTVRIMADSKECESDFESLQENASNSINNRPARKYAEFIRGPLPLAWFQLASRLRGKSLEVALAIWWRCGIDKSRRVALSMGHVRRFGVLSRKGRREALARLEDAGLITVERSATKSPIITIVETDDNR